MDKEKYLKTIIEGKQYTTLINILQEDDQDYKNSFVKLYKSHQFDLNNLLTEKNVPPILINVIFSSDDIIQDLFIRTGDLILSLNLINECFTFILQKCFQKQHMEIQLPNADINDDVDEVMNIYETISKKEKENNFQVLNLEKLIENLIKNNNFFDLS